MGRVQHAVEITRGKVGLQTGLVLLPLLAKHIGHDIHHLLVSMRQRSGIVETGSLWRQHGHLSLRVQIRGTGFRRGHECQLGDLLLELFRAYRFGDVVIHTRCKA